MNDYPRETVEFCALEVRVGGIPVTAYDVQTTVRERPADSAWQPNIALSGEHGFMVQNLAPGTHRVWVRVTDNPETPVLELGSIFIS